MPRGERIHVIQTWPDVNTPIGNCIACNVPAIVKRGRPVCPIAWRNNHGSAAQKKGILRSAKHLGIEVPRNTPRKHRLIGLGDGTVICAACKTPAESSENGWWFCPKAAARVDWVQSPNVELYDPTKPLPPKPKPREELTDADLGMAATTVTTAYRTHSGRIKGGEAVPTKTVKQYLHPFTGEWYDWAEEWGYPDPQEDGTVKRRERKEEPAEA